MSGQATGSQGAAGAHFCCRYDGFRTTSQATSGYTSVTCPRHYKSCLVASGIGDACSQICGCPGVSITEDPSMGTISSRRRQMAESRCHQGWLHPLQTLVVSLPALTLPWNACVHLPVLMKTVIIGPGLFGLYHSLILTNFIFHHPVSKESHIPRSCS